MKTFAKAFSSWTDKRIPLKLKCAVELGRVCVPLFNDPICRACCEAEQAKKEGKVDE